MELVTIIIIIAIVSNNFPSEARHQGVRASVSKQEPQENATK